MTSSTLPPGWTWCELADVASFINGDRGKNYPAKAARVSHGVPFINAGHLDAGRVDMRDMDFISRDRFELLGGGKVHPGDLLFCLRGSLGKAALVTLNEGAIASSLVILRPTGAPTSEYLLAYLQSPLAASMIARYDNGTAQPNLSSRNVERFLLPLAPASEQVRIVEALDAYLTRLDAVIAGLEAARRKLKAYRASVLNAAVEGRLVATEAELARNEGRSYEPADALLDRILKERRRQWEESELAKMKAAGKTPKDDRWKAKYSEPEPPDIANLPSLPEGWVWSTVDQLAGLDENALCDGPFGSNLKTEHYTEIGPRVIRLQNIGDGDFQDAEAHISEDHFNRLRRHAVHAADLVVASLGTELPRACQVPGWLGPAIVKADCLRFNVNDVVADPRFVLHALNSPPTRKRVETLVHGVGRPRIGLTLFRQTAIPLPPRSEQERIAEHVEELLSVARKIDLTLTAQERRSSRLRQAVLAWAFEGKLVDQDPSDEPADVLLARIRSERAAATLAQPKAKRSRKLQAAS